MTTAVPSTQLATPARNSAYLKTIRRPATHSLALLFALGFFLSSLLAAQVSAESVTPAERARIEREKEKERERQRAKSSARAGQKDAPLVKSKPKPKSSGDTSTNKLAERGSLKNAKRTLPAHLPGLENLTVPKPAQPKPNTRVIGTIPASSADSQKIENSIGTQAERTKIETKHAAADEEKDSGEPEAHDPCEHAGSPALVQKCKNRDKRNRLRPQAGTPPH